MKGQIKITLRSDLCAASGDGFSLAIDTDVCSDRYGFPYIPSRRLKGVMRHAAKYIGINNINEIFGESGDNNGGFLQLSNAVLENYDSLVSQLITSKNKVLPEQVLSLFSSVKASTAIEGDTAKKESLRFMRVINKYSPFDGHDPLVFVADVDFGDTQEDTAKNICRAVRNIGYKRSRGFGAVSCEFIDLTKNSKTNEAGKNNSVSKNDEFIEGNTYRLNYVIKLDSPLMITGTSGSETADHINGGAVLGALAAKYLKEHKDSDIDEELFLKNNVVFSNLYIAESAKEEGTEEKEKEKSVYIIGGPSPAVLGKTKDSPDIKFVKSDDNEKATEKENDKNDSGSKTVKAFKKGYLYGGEDKKVKTETIYHNGGFTDSANHDKTLYTQTVICEGQMFAGYIEAQGKYMQEIYSLFEDRILRLGRSKTAQYSLCRIVDYKTDPKAIEGKESYNDKAEVYAVLQSDVLLLDENKAGYTTEFDVLADAIKSRVNGITISKEKSSLKFKTITGFVSKGRYKKPHIRAFAAGSAVCFEVNGTGMELPKEFRIGEKQGEGFGVIRLYKKDELIKAVGDKYVFEKAEKKNPENNDSKTDTPLTDLLNRNIIIEDIRTSALDFASENKEKLIGLGAAFIGRVSLMIAQAVDENDLDKRIDSIKTKDKKESIISIKSKAKNNYNKWNEWEYRREYLSIVFTIAKYNKKESEAKNK